MRTIETTMVVDAAHRASIQLPEDVTPGTHRVVVVIEGTSGARGRPTMADFPRHDIPWPFAPDETFRREDMYGDDGRGA